ncbi:undecaprenyl-phosphate glucose phosphotransferase [Aestuariivirga litoralis]|nr:undecaprenyl-phosphate glucose phosphotransferase [Aestuariivirga litoralis]
MRAAVSTTVRGKPFVSPQLAMLLAAFIDIVVTLAGAFTIAIHYPGSTALQNWLPYASFAALGCFILVQVSVLTRDYAFSHLLSPFRRLPHLIFAWALSFLLLSAAIFLFKAGEDLSRVWLISWSISGAFLFVACRFLLGGFLRKLNADGRFNKRVVLVGGGENAARVISAIESSPDSGANLIGIFDDRDDTRSAAEVKGLYKLGGMDDLIDFVRSTRVDTLIITLPTAAEDRVTQIMSKLWVLPVDIRLSAQSQRLRLRPRAYSFIGNLPCLDVYDRPLGDWGPYFKAVLDKTMAAVALAVLSPVMAVIAIAIKMDSKGPVFFKQKRYGFNNELIEVYKFRSMYVNQTDANATKLVTKGDARVTGIGRFIRRTTLDELPQFINVLKGDLSLVGPRPHATQAKAAEALYEHVVDGYFARHRVKPGITGWAQINGWRGETDTAEKIERRVEHDLFYIENWSLMFDIYILLRTPAALMNTENAY